MFSTLKYTYQVLFMPYYFTYYHYDNFVAYEIITLSFLEIRKLRHKKVK